MKPTEALSPEEAGRVQTVSDFTRRVKELLRGGLPPGWIRGEVSNLRAQSSGHVYFSLKDDGAQLSCVLFRGDALRQTVVLRDGLQILAFGNVDVYEARGQYQLVVRAVVEDGAGRLQQEFERLKQRLAAEGLFDPERKIPIPLMPDTIGFVTSPTGAALQDFIRILERRGWTGRLLVFPARVQGEGAAAEIAELVRWADERKLVDLLVVGRGGGSIEDLWAFNEEIVVRAVAACALPIISAVGHEIDFTLCDFAADVRAETPSAAAELISSNYLEAQNRAERAGEALREILDEAVTRGRDRLDHARSRLRLLSPSAAIEQHFMRLDDLTNRLAAALRISLQVRRELLGGARARLAATSPEKRVQFDSHRLLALWKRLESASPKSVLSRGYAIVRDESGRPVVQAAAAQKQKVLVNEFHDGKVRVRVE
ncbi:MAG TPA: exodeoxyribonuclease VII large subunit [Candidatus Didemnitutus sp.]|nr:exodeoxyribonuclease VII large subunit [Candidatus Didemnitutus sp.]